MKCYLFKFIIEEIQLVNSLFREQTENMTLESTFFKLNGDLLFLKKNLFKKGWLIQKQFQSYLVFLIFFWTLFF